MQIGIGDRLLPVKGGELVVGAGIAAVGCVAQPGHGLVALALGEQGFAEVGLGIGIAAAGGQLPPVSGQLRVERGTLAGGKGVGDYVGGVGVAAATGSAKPAQTGPGVGLDAVTAFPVSEAQLQLGTGVAGFGQVA